MGDIVYTKETRHYALGGMKLTRHRDSQRVHDSRRE